MVDDFEAGLRRPPSPKVAAFRKCCNEDVYRVEIPEWVLSGLLVIVGLHILIWPSAASGSHMALLFTVLSVYGLASLCIWIGIGRLVLLAIRRKTTSQATMRLRVFLSILSGLVWGQMAYAIFARFVALDGGIPPGFEMLIGAQVVTDFWVAYRIKRHLGQLRRKEIL